MVIGAAVRLIGEAGARRIRILEGSSEDDHPLEENFLIGGWNPAALLNAAPSVEMENTGFMGNGKDYTRLEVPEGGLIYPAFDVNHSYAECDVLVSIAKLKEHERTGLSLSLKNMVGIAPGTIYGDSAGYDAPAARPFGERTMFHIGNRQPPEGTPPEKDPKSPREFGYRIPRITVDLARARPISLALIDGVETQTAGAGAALDEGAKRQMRFVKPGILIASLNPVCADAVATAVMGFDIEAIQKMSSVFIFRPCARSVLPAAARWMIRFLVATSVTAPAISPFWTNSSIRGATAAKRSGCSARSNPGASEASIAAIA